MSPGLVLNKLDLYFPTTGLLILRSALAVVAVITGAVYDTVVLDNASPGTVGRPSFLASGRGGLFCPEEWDPAGGCGRRERRHKSVQRKVVCGCGSREEMVWILRGKTGEEGEAPRAPRRSNGRDRFKLPTYRLSV